MHTPSYPATAPACSTANDLRSAAFPQRYSLHSDPHGVGHDNTAKAGFASCAVVAYATRTGALTSDPLQTVVTDLVTDLRHLCDTQGFDWDALAEDGSERYRDELNGR